MALLREHGLGRAPQPIRRADQMARLAASPVLRWALISEGMTYPTESEVTTPPTRPYAQVAG
jgi:hypothetical protein